MSEQHVTDEELNAILRDMEADGSGYRFHRIQDGYPDKGPPRAVFVHPDEEPVGIPIPETTEPLTSLVQRMAEDIRDARDVLGRIVAAWREDEIGQIDGELIEEAEALLGIEAPRGPLAVEDAEPTR